MLRFVMISIMFIICTYIGFYYGETYRNRSSNLKEIQKAFIMLNSEISYSNTPLPDALKNISNRVGEPISKILLDMSINLNDVDIKGVYEAFTIAYKKYKDEINLSKDDYKILSDFFKTIGECDAVTQEKVFTVALENLNLNYIDANNEANVNVKMYRTLGISIGIMIAIFFI